MVHRSASNNMFFNVIPRSTSTYRKSSLTHTEKSFGIVRLLGADESSVVRSTLASSKSAASTSTLVINEGHVAPKHHV